MAITIDVKALVSDAVKNLDVVNDRIDAQDRAVNKLAKAQHDLEASSLKLADAQKSLSKNTDPAKQHDLESAVLSARVALDKQQGEVEQLARSYKGLDAATVETKGGFADLAGKFEELTGVGVTTAMTIGGIGAAIGSVYGVVNDSIGRFGEYAESVRGISSAYSLSADQASELIQVLDDARVKPASLETAFRSMADKGILPTVENLARLSDQFVEIHDPIERATFLTDTFGGRAGPEMAKALALGGDALRQYAKDARDAGLLMTEADLAASERLKQAQDRLADAQTQFDKTIGLAGTEYYAELMDAAGDAWNQIGEWMKYFTVNTITQAEWQNEMTQAISDTRREAIALSRDYVDAATREELAQRKASLAAADLNSEMEVLNAGLSGRWSNSFSDFNKKQDDVRAGISNTEDAIADLEGRKYLTEDQKGQLEALNLKLAEQQGILQTNAEEWTTTSNRIVFDMLRQTYAVDGLSKDEIDALTDAGEALGIYDTKTAEIMRSVQRSIEEHGTDAIGVLSELNGSYITLRDLPNIEKTITMKYQKVGDENFGGWTPPKSPGSGGGGGGSTNTDNTQLTGVQGGYASGGSFVVPGSGTGDRPYVVNLTPGERVDVTPVGKAGGGAGPIIGTLNVYGTDGQSVQELAREVSRVLAARLRSKAGAAL